MDEVKDRRGDEGEIGDRGDRGVVAHLLSELLDEEKEIAQILRGSVPRSTEVTAFHVVQLDSKGAPMAAKGIAPGSTGTFAAGPANAQGQPAELPAAVIPAWTSSDPVNAPVAASPDGSTASVSVPANAPTGTPFTLSIQATLPDGTTPKGSLPVPVLVAEVTQFIPTQTS